MNEHSSTSNLAEVVTTHAYPNVEAIMPAPDETASVEPGTAEPAATEPTVSEPTVGSAKKPRAARAPKLPITAEASSVTAIVERVVRLSTLDEAHTAALGRLFNITLPDERVARLTRLTAISLSPIGNSSAEALAIVLSLESANLIHVGVQLGRLAPTALPDVFRCAHALTGSTAPNLAKGDLAVFAVADVLATLTTDEFTLARALRESLASQ